MGDATCIGLALGIAVLAVLLVPSLLRDEPAIAVALVGGVAVVGIALYLAHGFIAGTAIALLGSVASLLLVALLASLALAAAHITGLGDEQTQVLSITAVPGACGDDTGGLTSGVVAERRGSRSETPHATGRRRARVLRPAPRRRPNPRATSGRRPSRR